MGYLLTIDKFYKQCSKIENIDIFLLLDKLRQSNCIGQHIEESLKQYEI